MVKKITARGLDMHLNERIEKGPYEGTLKKDESGFYLKKIKYIKHSKNKGKDKKKILRLEEGDKIRVYGGHNLVNYTISRGSPLCFIHNVWKDSFAEDDVNPIIYKGSKKQRKELEALMDELPLMGVDAKLHVEFRKSSSENKKGVYIKPLGGKIYGVSCMFKDSTLDYTSPIRFVTFETDSGYIQLTYKKYDLWIKFLP